MNKKLLKSSKFLSLSLFFISQFLFLLLYLDISPKNLFPFLESYPLAQAASFRQSFKVPAELSRFKRFQPDKPTSNTEIMHLAVHGDRIFAATGQWMSTSQKTGAQILVKKDVVSPWRVFQRTKSQRINALSSFVIPAEYNNGSSRSILVTQFEERNSSHNVIAWLLDDSNTFDDTFKMPSQNARVRAFGTHADGKNLLFSQA